MNAIQYLDESDSEQTARQVFDAMRAQVCYLGGRLLAPCAIKPRWRVQTFHYCTGVDRGAILPHGCRFVFIPQGSRAALGIK